MSMEKWMAQEIMNLLSDMSFITGALDEAGIKSQDANRYPLRQNERVWILINQRDEYKIRAEVAKKRLAEG